MDTSLQQDTLERCHAEHEAAMAEMRRELAATVRLFRAAEQDLGGVQLICSVSVPFFRTNFFSHQFVP